MLVTLTDAQKRSIQDSWLQLSPQKDAVADMFYSRLFQVAPAYKALFQRDLGAQKQKFLAMLQFIVKALDWESDDWLADVDEDDDLFMKVATLGRRHREIYAVPDEAYPIVGRALLWTLEESLGGAFRPETGEAWSNVYALLSTTMMLGCGAMALGEPGSPASVELNV